VHADRDRGVEDEVVEARRDAPVPQRMQEHRVRVATLIRVKLMEETVRFVGRDRILARQSARH
jgi:hypothetical protein